MERPVILFFYADARDINIAAARHLWIARQRGFRTIFASELDIHVRDRCVHLARAFEVLDRAHVSHLEDIDLQPSVVVHRKLVTIHTETLFERISDALPSTALSYAPSWRCLDSKWDAELTLRSGDARGIVVPRPPTYLVRSGALLDTLWTIAKTRALVIKPPESFECRGIILSDPTNFADILRDLDDGVAAPYVVQELAGNPVLFRGKKIDLRVYLLLTSFHPLRFRVFRGGVVRVASHPYDPAHLVDPLVSLTGSNFRRERGCAINDLTIEQLLHELGCSDENVASFWQDVDDIMWSVLECFKLRRDVRTITGSRFFLAGVDLLLVEGSSRPEVLFLECNYAPSLNDWGPELDLYLETTHWQWLDALYCEYGDADAAAS